MSRSARLLVVTMLGLIVTSCGKERSLVDSQPAAQPVTVTITRDGGGSGTVTSTPNGIDCGASCSLTVPSGTTLTFDAAPDATSTFQGWNGGGCGGTDECTLIVTSDISIDATFAKIQYTVTIAPIGNGVGEVVSAPAGIDCGTSCASVFDAGTQITLTATPGTTSTFLGWTGGGCSGTGACTFTPTADTTVQPSFVLDDSLQVLLAGTGTGTVTSADGDIQCGATCTHQYSPSTMVTLTAKADATSTFTGWSGACTGTGACQVTIAQATQVTATFTLKSFTLTAQDGGTGTGTITSADGDIDCGTTCTHDYDDGTMVTLTATAATGSSFTGWSGACTGTGSCQVTITAATTVKAVFVLVPETLTVATNGDNGTGTVTSAPTGINCGTACTLTVAYGSAVTLTAAPDATSTFTGWSGGGCSGTSTCVVSMTAATTVTASFTLKKITLTATKTGNGSGTIASADGGIACGGTCTYDYDDGTVVTLTATPSTGSTFTGWTGACTGTAMCTVAMTAATTVTAGFTLQKEPLGVSTTGGAGSGSVASSPTGIACGAGSSGTCSASFDYNTQVTLTPTAATGSTFAGWSGGGCSGTSACTVSMIAAQNVTASFTLQSIGIAVSTTGGNGTGSVGSSPTGIACGAGSSGTCAASFDYGTAVTLTASPATGSTFTGWSGGGCSGTSTCVVTVKASVAVTASFTLQKETLGVSTTGGPGSGAVASSPTGIACGVGSSGTCSAGFDYGTTVLLTPTAATGSTFAGWSGGGCSGTGTCIVPMTGAQSVTATFALQSITLVVSTTGGAGTGAVASSPTGIACGAGSSGTCSANFDYGTPVTLTPTAATGSTFAGWSGGGCSGAGACVVTIKTATLVTASFTLQPETLAVSTTGGAGSGSIASSPTGIACGAGSSGTCSASFDYGTMVALTPTAATGSSFTGWSGACSGTGACSVSMTAARSVTASFALQPETLTVSTNGGTGTGTVSSSPGGITNCTACSANFAYGTVVTLTPSPSAGSAFTGWSGACTGTGACSVSMTAARGVTASFTLQAEPLTVATNGGNGSGTLSSSPGGINNCTSCSASFAYGTLVSLTPSPSAGSTFTGWSGACSGTGACTVSMTSAASVTASFTLGTVTLSVGHGGTGGGSISSTDGAISCGEVCSATYNYGTTVTLTASPTTGSTFSGWSGGGCSGTGNCVTTLTASTTVTANFAAIPYTLTVSTSGAIGGTGSVTSDVGGINCGTACTATLGYGTFVTLTANPAAGSSFAGWGGACASYGTSTTCFVSILGNTSVSASFTCQVTTFAYTGAVQTWVPPACATRVHIEVWGAQGTTGLGTLGGSTGYGGLGGYAKGDMTVTGQQLSVYVGGQSGWNGGGLGASSTTPGNGGDESDVRRDGARIIVGGGGGGGVRGDGTNYFAGGAGGGGTCSSTYQCGGAGGVGELGNNGPNGSGTAETQPTAADGAGGGGGGTTSSGVSSCESRYANNFAPPANTCGGAGTLGKGGAGDVTVKNANLGQPCFTAYGGSAGGGAGYYGGGGTASGSTCGGGGGGGASFMNSGLFTNPVLTAGARSGLGQVTITPF